MQVDIKRGAHQSRNRAPEYRCGILMISFKAIKNGKENVEDGKSNSNHLVKPCMPFIDTSMEV